LTLTTLTWTFFELCKQEGNQMHSHDRTLLSSLGFADPDKRDKRHDWACQYLSLPENVTTIVKTRYPWPEEPGTAKVRSEFALSKGEGQYKTTIGFIDLIVVFADRRRGCAVEVKIHPVGAGEILRQINLYREFVDAYWLVATEFAMEADDVEQMRAAGIVHVRLGDKFDAYCKARSTAAESQSPEI
jgi:hypothetical protein